MESIPRFAFLGSPTFAATILSDGLVAKGWSPILVVTEQAKPVGRKQVKTPTAVAKIAQAAHLPVATPTKKHELTATLSQLDLDLAIVAAYGRIIPEDALKLPKFGIVNIHASLLPKYRGASPIQAAILSGDTLTGLSYMLIEPTLDTGPVIKEETLPILATDTTASLTTKLANRASETLVPTLTAYLENRLQPVAQNDTQAIYTKKITKADGQVKLATISANTLDRILRAYTPWPGVFTTEFGKRLLIKQGRKISGGYLITQLQWEGKSAVSGADFARSYPKILTSIPETIKIDANM